MCDCPFCPLVGFKISTCDILARFKDTKKNPNITLYIPNPVLETRTEAEKEVIRECFVRIAYVARNHMRRDKLATWGGEGHDHSLHVQRHGMAFKICFHTKKTETEEDPK